MTRDRIPARDDWQRRVHQFNPLVQRADQRQVIQPMKHTPKQKQSLLWLLLRKGKK